MSGGVGGRGLVTPSYPIADYSTMVMVFVSVPTVRVCSPGWSMVSSISTTRQSPPLTAMIFSAMTSPSQIACTVVMPSSPLFHSRTYAVNGTPALVSTMDSFAVIGNDNRDARTAVLRQRLHRIVVHNLLRGRAVGVVQMAGDVQHVNVAPHRARRERRAFIRHDAFRPEHVAQIRKVNAHRAAAGVHMVEKPRSFFQRHLVIEVFHARVHVLPPVLVDIQLTIAVQVLELEPIHFQNGGDAIEIPQFLLGISVPA